MQYFCLLSVCGAFQTEYTHGKLLKGDSPRRAENGKILATQVISYLHFMKFSKQVAIQPSGGNSIDDQSNDIGHRQVGCHVHNPHAI